MATSETIKELERLRDAADDQAVRDLLNLAIGMVRSGAAKVARRDT